VDLVRLAYYPFLPAVRPAVREVGPDVPTLLASRLYAPARGRGMERVEGALGDGFAPARILDERTALHELLSIPVARMLVVLAGDKWLAGRYAAVEAAHLARTLDKDPEEATLDGVLEAVGLAARREGAAWRIHFADYLRVMPREPEWKLVNRVVEKGAVHLSRADVVRLASEALRMRIESELVAEIGKPLPAEVRQALQPLLDRIGPRLAEARERMQEGDFGPMQRELFPPCMTDTFHAMATGTMVPHHARFAFASFLATIGMNAENIMDFFKEVPNFDPEKSRYQIEHIAGERSVEKYTPPGCDWMQTNGVCPLAKRDALCFKIKHPLSYYRARLRFQDEDKKRSAEMIAAAQAGGGATSKPTKEAP
jgi:DNA primase large subunit